MELIIVIYKLKTSLDISTCEKKLRENLINDFIFMLIGQIGYVGSFDSLEKKFWIINRENYYKKSKGKHRFFSVKMFRGELYESKEGTKIVGEFKPLTAHRMLFGILSTIIALFLAIYSYKTILDYIVYKYMQISSILSCLTIFIIGLIVWRFIQHNNNNSERVKEDTLTLLTELLEVDSVQRNNKIL